MKNRIDAETLLYTEETCRILTVTAILQLRVCDLEGGIRTADMLRNAIEILSEQAECPGYLKVFDEAIQVENDLLKIPLSGTVDEMSNAVRIRQSWRAEKYMLTVAEGSDRKEELHEAAQYLRDFWMTDDPEPYWFETQSLMKA